MEYHKGYIRLLNFHLSFQGNCFMYHILRIQFSWNIIRKMECYMQRM